MARDGKPWYRKGKGAWYVWHGGRQHRLGGDKKEAFRCWHEMVANGGPLPASAARTVREVLTSYLDQARCHLRGSTLERYADQCRAFTVAFGSRPAAELKPADAERWAASQAWSSSTQWLALTVVNAAFR